SSSKANNPRRHDSGLAAPPFIDVSVGRRARLRGASALAGGALRGLAAAAGMAATLGAAPAFAGCNSGNVANTSLLPTPACTATATDAQSTAVGPGTNATGLSATAYRD